MHLKYIFELWQRHKLIVLAVVLVAAGFAAGLACNEIGERLRLAKDLPRSISITRQSNISSSSYKFINPLIGCQISENRSIIEYGDLRDEISRMIDRYVSAGDIKTASVYFDKRDGSWLSINPGEKFFPASLMKVPVMIAVLKIAETQPELLNKKIFYDGSFDYNSLEYFKPSKALAARQYYTVDDLLSRMVSYSDNNALALLLNSIDVKTVGEIFTDFGISPPTADNAALSDYITIKQYAYFFRVLYNATYLNRDMSEKALDLLSAPDFPQGIMAGIPTGVRFADKFGEKNFGDQPDDPASDKELHDCGIIYLPNHPYLLCIMTKGTDFDKLSSVIKDISHTVYGYMEKK